MQAYAGPRGAEMEWELRGLIMAVSKMKWKEKPWKSLAGKLFFRDIFKTSFDASSFCPMLWITIRLWAETAGVLGEAVH